MMLREINGHAPNCPVNSPSIAGGQCDCNLEALPHPLTIPGELLAEACEIGLPSIGFNGRKWVANISASTILRTATNFQGFGKNPAEALQAAIAKAREESK